MKYILAILLTILALTATASSGLQQLLKDIPADHLAVGVPMVQAPAISDFNNIPREGYRPVTYWMTSNANESFYPGVNWYHYDFAADPFDGRIEVLVVGEPLPSASMTIFIMAAIVGIIYWCRFKPDRELAF